MEAELQRVLEESEQTAREDAELRRVLEESERTAREEAERRTQAACNNQVLRDIYRLIRSNWEGESTGCSMLVLEATQLVLAGVENPSEILRLESLGLEIPRVIRSYALGMMPVVQSTPPSS